MNILSTHPASAPRRSFREEIASRVNNGRYDDFLFIVPTNAFARQEIDRVYEVKTSAFPAPHIYSLQEFIQALHTRIVPYRRLISDAESAALLELTLVELFDEHSLKYLERRNYQRGALPIQSGTFDDIAATIKRLQQKGISPDRFEKDIAERSGSTEILRSLDILSIYRRYLEKLGSSLIDLYGQANRIVDMYRLDKAAGSLKSEFQCLFHSVYPNVNDIFVELFIDLDEPARLILNACSNSAAIHQYVEDESNNAIFALQNSLAVKQQTAGYEFVNEGNQIFSFQESALIQFLKDNLFKRSHSRIQKFNASDIIFIRRAESFRREAEAAAYQIKEILLNETSEYDPSRICVAAYRQEVVSEVVSQVFEDFGIPYTSSERFILDTSPLFTALDSLFRLIEFGLSTDEMLRFLTSPYFMLTNEESVPIDSANLVAMISQIPLPSGAREWHTDIQEHINHLEESVLDDSEIDAERNQLLLDVCRKGLADIAVIELLLNRFSGRLTADQCIKEVRSLLNSLHVQEEMFTDTDPLLYYNGLEFDTRSYRAIDELLDEYLSLVQSLNIATEQLSASEHFDRLRAAARTKRFAPRVEPESGVIIASFDQIAGYDFDYLFIIGCNDDVFPKLYRQPVTEPKEYISSEIDHSIAERYSFYQLLRRFVKHLTISWVQHSENDPENLPSSFIEALMRIVSVTELSSQLSAPNIYSSSDFSRYAVESRHKVISESDISTNDLLWDAQILPIAESTAQHRKSAAIHPYGGQIPIDQLSTREKQYFTALRDTSTFSISQLELYAKCPFKYFSKYILHIREEQKIDGDNGLDTTERGTILHTVMYKILKDIQDAGKRIHTMPSGEFAGYDKYSSDYYSEKSIYRNPFWRIDIESTFQPSKQENIWHNFIRAEESKDITTTPAYFEMSDTVEIVDESGGNASFRMKAKIDRIDIDTDNRIFTVVDYKTKTSPHPNEIREGLSLQLPLYLRVAEDILRKHIGKEMAGVAAFYYHLLDDEKGKKPAMIVTEYTENVFNKRLTGRSTAMQFESVEELENVIRETIRFANEYINGIQRGEFPLTTEEMSVKICSTCDYQRACRLQEAVEHSTLSKSR